MQRYIKSFSTLTDAHIALIRMQYPNGFDRHDLTTMKTGDGRSFEVLEVRGEDAIYLVKVNDQQLSQVDESWGAIPDTELLSTLGAMSGGASA